MAATARAHREHRAALLRAETELREHTERVARLRRELSPGPLMPAYPLVDGSGPVDLADLFAPGHDTLVVHHLMFWADGACPMCSMWLDGLNGVAAHLAQHVSLAVTAPVPLTPLQDWGRARGWDRLRLVSAADTSLGRDLGFVDDDGGQMPGVSVFTRDGREMPLPPAGGGVRLFWHGQPGLVDGGRGIDALSPVWNLLDLTPGGRPDWWPGNDYPLSFARGGAA